MVRGLYQALVVFTFTLYSCSLHNDKHGLDVNSEYETIGLVAFLAFLWSVFPPFRPPRAAAPQGGGGGGISV